MKTSGTRRKTKLEYLQANTETVVIKNEKDEIEIMPTKNCKVGDTVWVVEADDTFTITKIY